MSGLHSEKKVLVILFSILFAFSTVLYAANNTLSIHALADECSIDYAIFDASDPYLTLEALSETQGANVKEEYRLTKCLDVAYGKVYKFQQSKDGMDVFGEELIISVNNEGRILSVFGQYFPVKNLTKPVLSETGIIDMVAKQKGTTVSVVDTIVYPMNDKAQIAYEAVCIEEGMQYIVSAVDGEILRSFPIDRKNSILMRQKDADGNDVSVDIEYDGRTYLLSDYTRNIFTLNANNSIDYAEYYENDTGIFDPIAVSAYANVIKAYDFYADEKNIGVSLRGVNGGNDDIWGNFMERSEEIPIMIVVHYGDQYENAHCGYDPYSGSVFMLIGDGKIDGELYQPARALDVIAHEYQHAVTVFAADLTYMNDSGALDEAFSDVFGMLVEGHDPSEEEFWIIGENAVANGAEIRSVKGGTAGYRYSVKDKIPNCELNHDHIYCDYGGAHYNSTIISHVQYLLSQARPDFFTREKIGQLWYSTLCGLGSEATFDDFAEQFYQSAVNLGFEDEICQLIQDCLEESGLITRYAVKFVDYDDSIIYETRVLSGESVDYPEMPQQKQTPQYILEFTGWSNVPENITQDMTIRAQYKFIQRKYTVTFYDMDGNILTQKDHAYGDKINPPSFSEMQSPYLSEDYIFDGWYLDENFSKPMSDFDAVEGEMAIYGKWTKKPQETPNYTWLYILLAVAACCVIAGAIIIIFKKKHI